MKLKFRHCANVVNLKQMIDDIIDKYQERTRKKNDNHA